jgi:hypothetical protein
VIGNAAGSRERTTRGRRRFSLARLLVHPTDRSGSNPRGE